VASRADRPDIRARRPVQVSRDLCAEPGGPAKLAAGEVNDDRHLH
jgi:hypothetical protein